MKNVWQRMSLREQHSVLALGLMLLIVAAYSLIWQPTGQHLDTAERRLQQQMNLTTQLQQARPRNAAQGLTNQPLSLRLSEGATAAGLELQQMDTDSDVLRLTIRGDAKTLLHWLDGVERDGTKLQSLTLEKRETVLEARVVIR